MHAMHLWKQTAEDGANIMLNHTFPYKHIKTHSQENLKSHLCKQMWLWWNTASHEYTQILAWACTHTEQYTHTQPQLFCYFPLQHLVLISFLMRLQLRPIREDYQRRSRVGCMPTMTLVPRDRPGWKRPALQTHIHLHAHREPNRNVHYS